MPFYDQLIEFAREKQRGRRSAVVHKSVKDPIVVLVLGDKQQQYLDTLYTQLCGRWSSRLQALQVCYCYVDAPYTGANPILQTRLELPAASGAGAICALPETLAAVNGMAGQAIERISHDPQISMRRGNIHVVLAPEDPAGMLLSDLVAVFKSRLEDFGFFTLDCRLYLLLPWSFQTQRECEWVCGVLDQLREAQEYDQPVLQPQVDAAPRQCRIERLINAVMLLDSVNENGQHYNVHGERLNLLLDLVEHGWDNSGFLQTAGAREGSAGPEYWLAHALDTLCARQQEPVTREESSEMFKAVSEAITEATQQRTGGLDRALRACCFFRPGQTGRLRQLSVEDAETAVFGSALRSAYAGWQKNLEMSELPPAVRELLDRVSSETQLETLMGQLEQWLKECEITQARPAQEQRLNLSLTGNDVEDAARLRGYLYKEKYLPLADRERQSFNTHLVSQCRKYCLNRKEELRSEEADFEEFARGVRQTWITLRDAYNDGREMELTWIDRQPEPSTLRKACALALRSGDPTQVLSMAADCVDLSGNANSGARCADPPLFCSIPFTMGLNMRLKTIEEGVSSGRVLKFAVLAQEYDEEMLQQVHVLKKARESI